MDQSSFEKTFTKSSTLPFIPDKLIKSIITDKRKLEKVNALHNGRKVQLVDGTYIPLIDKELFRRGIDGRHHKDIVKERWEKELQDKEEEEEEKQKEHAIIQKEEQNRRNQKINDSRMESQFLAFIFSLLKGQLIDRNKLFSKTFWRLTRTQLSGGGTLSVRWIIDDRREMERWKDSLSSAFQKTIPSIRYCLGSSCNLGRKRRGLERVPEVRFEYENFD